MRRAPKDSRARETLVRFALWLVLVAVAIGYVHWYFRGIFTNFGSTGTAVYIVIGLSVVLIIVARKISERRDRRAQVLDSVSDEMKRQLLREACVLAIVLERLASESYLEKEIPPNVTIVTRRILLDRLTAMGLRDGLEPWLLDLLLAPDGHWTAEQKQRAMAALECFEVLRWILGLSELRSLTADPKYSVADARSLIDVKEPEKLLVLASWDIRPARDGAARFFHRCWAELVARREISTAAEPDVERALAVRAQIEEAGYTGDYLIGARTIPELDTQLLFFVTRRAYTRWQFLSLLVDILAGDAPVGSLRKFLARYFAPADVAEALNADARA